MGERSIGFKEYQGGQICVQLTHRSSRNLLVLNLVLLGLNIKYRSVSHVLTLSRMPMLVEGFCKLIQVTEQPFYLKLLKECLPSVVKFYQMHYIYWDDHISLLFCNIVNYIERFSKLNHPIILGETLLGSVLLFFWYTIGSSC